jgi:pimeloyl-ACP methyl ester carboxylesterase
MPFTEDCTAEALEVLVLAAFREHLARAAFGVDDDFFEAGGDSARATQLVHAVSRVIGTQVPTDVLFQYPTPRALAAFLQPGHDGIPADPRATVVSLRQTSHGRPIFLIPALYPSPWVFVPLVDALSLRRPIYGLRAPELDWRSDVQSLTELVACYLVEIRRRQPRGPYSLVAYSFGGLVAFEIAQRLAADDEVSDLILLDTAGPPTLRHRLGRRARPSALREEVLGFLCRHEIIGARTLSRLGITSVIARAALAFTEAPLSAGELRIILRLIAPDITRIDRMSLEALCATTLATIRATAPPEEWAVVKRLLLMQPDDALATVKAWKVVGKNRGLTRDHRIRVRRRVPITVFASEGHRDVLRWRRYSSRPLDVRWVTVASYQGTDTHRSFLDARNVRLYARELQDILEEPAAEGLTA